METRYECERIEVFVRRGGHGQGGGGTSDFPEKQRWKKYIVREPVCRFQEDIIGQAPAFQHAAEEDQHENRKKAV